MNPLNYASLEASKRLVDNGIVLETEFYWPLDKTDWKKIPWKRIPHPSMAEVWRELPTSEKMPKLLTAYLDAVYQPDWAEVDSFDVLRDINKMIDLLIWVRKKKV